MAACPNCKTPYAYSSLPVEMQEDVNRKRKSDECFIATAAFGSRIHPHVQSLRFFRDNIILKSSHRHSFENLLDFYYRFSPPVAKAMNRNIALKISLRYSLVYPVVFGIKVVLPLFDLVLGLRRKQAKRNGQ